MMIINFLFLDKNLLSCPNMIQNDSMTLEFQGKFLEPNELYIPLTMEVKLPGFKGNSIQQSFS